VDNTANVDAVADRWAVYDGIGIVPAAGSTGALDGDAGVYMKPDETEEEEEKHLLNR
jgi:hypothetical protein